MILFRDVQFYLKTILKKYYTILPLKKETIDSYFKLKKFILI